MTKTELFLELAKPDKQGISRWVDVTEFVGKYKELQLGNGGSWCRKSSSLAKKYLIEFDKTKTKGNSIDAIKLVGLNKEEPFNQNIKKEIKDYYQQQKCVMLGIKGDSDNTKIEVDHKNGRKDDARVGNVKTQRYEDFQPLCKAANDAKRQICKKCKEKTGIKVDIQCFLNDSDVLQPKGSRENRKNFNKNSKIPVLFCLILWYTVFIIIDIVGVL